MNKLYQLLLNIQLSRPINFTLFIELLNKHNMQHHTDNFHTHGKTGKSKWVVTCDNEPLLNRLIDETEPVLNRVHAAQKGRSHNVKVSTGFLLVFHEEMKDDCPSVVVASSSLVKQGFTSKKILLIIENQENAFRMKEMLSHASECSERNLDLSNTDVAFGSGKQVMSRYFHGWYCDYELIYCAFDYDLAGLLMFEYIQAINPFARFLMPKSMSSLMPYFTLRPSNENELLEAIAMAEHLDFLSLANAFIVSRRFMEQESLLEITDE